MSTAWVAAGRRLICLMLVLTSALVIPMPGHSLASDPSIVASAEHDTAQILDSLANCATSGAEATAARRVGCYAALAAVANEANNDAVPGSPGGRGTIALLGLQADGRPTLLSSFDTGAASAEIVQFTPDADTLLVTNSDERTILVIDVRDPYAPALIATVPIPNGGEPTSLAVHPTGRYALVTVIDPQDSLSNGRVFHFSLASRSFEGAGVVVGPHPDSIAIARNGRYALVTNEADDDGAPGGPEGSLSVLRLRGPAITVTTTPISSFAGSGYTDFTTVEPEYATITPDNKYGLFTIQNPADDSAVGVIDLSSGRITDIERFAILGNGGSSRQAEPDGISAWRLRGATYAATANEEDQSVSVFEIKYGTAALLSTTRVEEFLPVPVDTDAGSSGQPNGLGNTSGTPADDPSFPFDDGEPDPEGIAVKVLKGRAIAVVGLEESGAALVLDLTDPKHVTSQGLVRNLSGDALEVDPASGADRSSLTGRPEGIAIADLRP